MALYPTQDGSFVLIAANQDTVFRRLAGVMGRPELAADARFATHTQRGQFQRELDALIADWTQTIDREELGRMLDEGGIPRGDIYRAPEMLEDVHFRARNVIVDVIDPILGRLKMQNAFPRLSETPGRVRLTGPALGQHNADVLLGILGYGQERIAALVEAGVVGPVGADAPLRRAD